MSLPPRLSERTAATEFRKLMTALAARARRLGSRNPEGAAQEAVKRSLVNPSSSAAVEYYFRDQPQAETSPPEWSLLQLLGWLHGVLRFVVLEEHARANREAITADGDVPEVPDAANSPLELVVDRQHAAIVREVMDT